jgi:5-bromo-4-chloroindolyl phosphate hydrolysis protein
MAGIKLHGFGRGENTQIELRDEPGSKRQKVEDDGLSSRKYEAIRDEVEEFVQGIKTQVVKTERVA